MRKVLSKDEKYQRRLKELEFMVEHFDEIPHDCQIDIAARAETIMDIFVRKKVG